MIEKKLWLIIFILLCSCSGDRTWNEEITLTGFDNQKSVSLEFDEVILEFGVEDVKNSIVAVSDYSGNFPYDSILFNKLDTLIEPLQLVAGVYFKTKIDTVYNFTSYEKDSVIIAPDYSDIRNYYFNTIGRVAINLLDSGKVKVYDKESNKKQAKKIIKKHTKEGPNTFEEFYLPNGKYIMYGGGFWGII